MEASFYEYTKSAKEIKKFKCEEKCREIAAEYERFNKENGVYEFFGEILLEVAKENYNMEFKESALSEYLKSKKVTPPESQWLEIEKSWYDESQAIRDVSPEYGGHKSKTDYFWYTLWQIAKFYNCKNGCLVIRTPYKRFHRYDEYSFEMDWSKKAEEFSTGEKFLKESKENNPCLFNVFVGTVFGFLFFVISISLFWITSKITNIFDPILSHKVYFAVFWIISTIIYNCIVCRKKDISFDIEKFSKEFNNHCKRIQETMPSKFNLEYEKQYD